MEEPERVKRGIDVGEHEHLAPSLRQKFAAAKLEVNLYEQVVACAVLVCCPA